jgi:hypothetical protein
MITNGYATLAEIKERWMQARTYAAATISFTASSKTIADSAKGLKRFPTNGLVKITGSTKNDGAYTIVTGDTPGSIIASESLIDEAAGATITLTDVSDPVDDAIFESMVTAISRAIDSELGRRFYTTSSDETRYYSPKDSEVLDTDDIISVASVAIDFDRDRTWSTVLAATDFELWPWNAALDGRPYLEIRIAPTGVYRFPLMSKAVKVTGKFGFSASAPYPIKEACLLAGQKLFRRKEAIFGVVGSDTLGTLKQIMKDDPELALLLDGYRKLV